MFDERSRVFVAAKRKNRGFVTNNQFLRVLGGIGEFFLIAEGP
jgi:hypothetical protein